MSGSNAMAIGTELNFQDVAIGDTIFTLVKEPISKIQVVRYAGASGDFNPIHIDTQEGREQIVHGMLVMGFVGQAVTSWVMKKYLRKFSVRFTGMTRPNDVITVSGKVAEKEQDGIRNIIRCNVTAKNQRDEIVVAGSFDVGIPKR